MEFWRFNFVFLLTMQLFFYGCVSNLEGFSDLISIDEDDEELLAVTSKVGEFAYKFKEQESKAPYVVCEKEGLKSYFFLAVTGSKLETIDDSYCKKGVSQGFLGAGYNIVAFALPGYSKATGTKDFGGEHSIASIEAFMNGFSGPDKGQIHGLWAYGEGSIAAFFHSKKHPRSPKLVVGGGIYDMENVARSTKHEELKVVMTQLFQKEGEAAFEKRSVSWDPSGLPQKVILYHAEKDEYFPKDGAVYFRDSLLSQGGKVSLSVLPGALHILNEKLHRSAVKKLLKEHDAISGLSRLDGRVSHRKGEKNGL